MRPLRAAAARYGTNGVLFGTLEVDAMGYWTKLAGGVIARPEPGINSIADLNSTKIGEMGGPTEHSWVLLRAYTRKKMDWDIADVAGEVQSVQAPSVLNDAITRAAKNARRRPET